MEFIRKYILILFLIENIMMQTFLMEGVAKVIFYPFMAVGMICVLTPVFWNPETIKKFMPLYLLMAVYVLYACTFGLPTMDIENLNYLIGKITTFGIIIISINYNESFYKKNGVLILIISMAFFLAYGLATGGGVRENSPRMFAGFTNVNTTGAMGALVVGMVVFYNKNKRWNIFSIICILLGFYGVLAGASRAGFLMLALLVVLRYGFNFKTLLLAGALIIFGLYILPSVGIHTYGLQRMMNTYEGIEGTNRDVEREAAEWMIAQKPITGWGFNVENQGYAAMLTEMPSHNGYMEITKEMGYPFAILYFLIIAISIIKYWRTKEKFHQPMELYFALVLMLLVKANYEASFIGVHEYGTNIFFVALAMISYHRYELKKSVRWLK